MAKAKTISVLKGLADDWFGVYIRLRQTDFRGFGKCITCGVKKNWRDANCGHFQSRAHMATRYHEQNSHFQCRLCNGPRGKGEQFKHALYIDKVYGKGVALQLEALARTTRKMTSVDFLEYAIQFRDLSRQEAHKRGIDISEYEKRLKIQ